MPDIPPAVPLPTEGASERLIRLFSDRHFADAEAFAHAVIENDPQHDLAWQVLGMIFLQQGRPDKALPALEHAAELLPNEPRVACNLGLAFIQLGRAHEAEACYRRSLALDPALAETHNNLGSALREQGRLDEAEACFRNAIALQADYARALANLGDVVAEQGKPGEAERCFRQALGIDPSLVNAANGLAMLLFAKGELSTAMELVVRTLQVMETPAGRQHFVMLARRMRFLHAGDFIRVSMARALYEPWGDPYDIAPTAALMITHTPAVERAIARVGAAWPRRLSWLELFADDDALLIEDVLLQALLVSSPVCDINLERMLANARHALLAAVSDPTDVAAPVDPAVLEFAGALAQQCFINEYVFPLAPGESSRADALGAALTTALDAGTLPAPLALAVVAAYCPLSSIAGASRLMDGEVPAAIAGLLTQQVREPDEEHGLRAATPKLTALSEGVSRSVGDMYEESPYPRWVKFAPTAYPTTIDQYLAATFPLASPQPIKKANADTDVLVAGCGTGKVALQLAGLFPGTRLLAIDLSRASLAYAQRKTREMAVAGIEYGQADLLQLGTWTRQFDLIECSGVIHHLADPWEGWRILRSRLRRGGLMKIGLYSAIARQDIVRARSVVAARGYRATPEDIRRCREDLVNEGASNPLGFALTSQDFFSASGCRDLLFHVQEQHMNLLQIADFLKEQRLRFLGFQVDPTVLHRYRMRFPDDRAAINLAHWDRFERDHPDTFASMYQFWVQAVSG